jgi:PAS domain S-box-containing protein
MVSLRNINLYFSENPNPMWVFNPDTLDILEVNQAALNMYGYERDEMLSLSIKDLRPKNEIPNLMEEVNKRKREFNDAGIWHHQKKNGDPLYVRILSQPVQWDDGVCKLVVAQDVTKQKKAEQKVKRLSKLKKEERNKIETINHRLNLLSYVGELFVQINDYDKALEKLAETVVSDFADICTIDLAEEDDFRRAAMVHYDPEKQYLAEKLRKKTPNTKDQEVVQHAIESGKPLFIDLSDPESVESVSLDKQQRSAIEQFSLNAALIIPLIVKKEPVGIMNLLWADRTPAISENDLEVFEELGDKTALSIKNAQMYEQLRQLNENLDQKVRERTAQLESAYKELESFSYSVSHDLRAPLRAIAGYSNLLLEDHLEDLDEEGKEFLTIIHDETNRMGELIDDLLAFSRMGRKEKEVQQFAMKKVVEAAIDEAKSLYPDLDPKFNIGELPVVKADSKLLKQMWLNLLNNAIKYHKSGQQPKIEIRASFDKDKQAQVFSVSDNGVGFNMKYADKIFGVFQRLHRDEEFEGTGIGLALTRRIINRHGGKIWAESEQGKGSTFYFSLPEKINSN